MTQVVAYIVLLLVLVASACVAGAWFAIALTVFRLLTGDPR